MDTLVDIDGYSPSLNDIALARACEGKFTDRRLREFDPEGDSYQAAYVAGETIIVAQDYEWLDEFERIAGDECQNLAGFIIEPTARGIEAVHRYGGCPYYASAYDWLDYGWTYIHDDEDDLWEDE